MYVNGTECMTDTWLNGPAPFNQPFFIALTQAIGVNGDAPTASHAVPGHDPDRLGPGLDGGLLSLRRSSPQPPEETAPPGPQNGARGPAVLPTPHCH